MISLKQLAATLAFALTLVSSLRLNSAQKYGYHTGSQIERIVDFLSAQNAQINKKTCNQAPLYNYAQIGSPGPSKINAVLVCNIHARELIASEICLNWLLNLNKASIVEQSFFTRVFYIANTNRQTFINNQTGCIRKNQNNVDANRNFPTDFNHWNSDPSNQTYGGKAALDQPLSQCLNRLFTQNKPDLFIDVHSGMNGFLYYQQGANNQQEISLLNQANERFCQSKCSITTLHKDGQTINGHIFADLKVRLQIPFSFLMQTFSKPSQSCFMQFNPTGAKKEKIIARYTNIINLMFKQVKEKLKDKAN